MANPSLGEIDPLLVKMKTHGCKLALLSIIGIAVATGCEGPSQNDGIEFSFISRGRLFYSYGNHVYIKDMRAGYSVDLGIGQSPRSVPGWGLGLIDDTRRIWTINFRTKERRPISSPPQGSIDTRPVWSEGLKSVVFVRSFGSRLYTFGGIVPAVYDLFCCDPNGNHLRRLTNQRFFDVSMYPQSDGTEYFYFTAYLPPDESPNKLSTDSYSWVYRFPFTHPDRLERLAFLGRSDDVWVDPKTKRIALLRRSQRQIYLYDGDSFRNHKILRDEDFLGSSGFDSDGNILYGVNLSDEHPYEVKRLSSVDGSVSHLTSLP